MRPPRPENLPKFKELVAESLAPVGINVLILEIDYQFQFQSHPELEGRGNEQGSRPATWPKRATSAASG